MNRTEKILLCRCVKFYITHHTKTDNSKFKRLLATLYSLEDNNAEKDRTALKKFHLPTSKETYGLTDPSQVTIGVSEKIL